LFSSPDFEALARSYRSFAVAILPTIKTRRSSDPLKQGASLRCGSWRSGVRVLTWHHTGTNLAWSIQFDKLSSKLFRSCSPGDRSSLTSYRQSSSGPALLIDFVYVRPPTNC
jgi:hypothetical protein